MLGNLRQGDSEEIGKALTICKEPRLDLPHGEAKAQTGLRLGEELFAGGWSTIKIAIEIEQDDPRPVARREIVGGDFWEKPALAPFRVDRSGDSARFAQDSPKHSLINRAFNRT